MCAGRACERRKRLFDLRLLLQIYMMRRSRRRAARWTFRKLGASGGERGKEGWREVGAARVPWRAVKELRKTNKKWADEGGGTGAAGWPRCAWSGKRGWRKRSTLFCSLSPSLQALSLPPLSLSETSNLTSGSHGTREGGREILLTSSLFFRFVVGVPSHFSPTLTAHRPPRRRQSIPICSILCAN